MTPEDIVSLIAYVSALCPGQRTNTMVGAAWLDALGDIPLPLAKRAACEVAKRQPFVAVADIRLMLTRMRKAASPHVRAAVNEVEGAYPRDPDVDWPAWCRWRNQRVAALVDGAIVRDLVHYGEEIRESTTSVDAAALPLKAVEAAPTVDRRAELAEMLHTPREITG